MVSGMNLATGQDSTSSSVGICCALYQSVMTCDPLSHEINSTVQKFWTIHDDPQ